MAYHNPQDIPLHHFTDQQQHHNQPLTDTSLLSDPNSKPASDPNQPAPNWLNNALLRTHYTDNDNDNNNNNTTNVNADNNNNNNGGTNFLNLHTAASDAGQWLARPILHRNHSEVIDEVTAGGDSLTAGAESGDLKGEAVAVDGGGDGMMNWQNARLKSEILAHPLYEQLLSAHVACLRIATPVDQLPRIDAQLAQSQNVVAKYSAFGQTIVGDDKELDHFLVISSFSFLFIIFIGLIIINSHSLSEKTL